MEPAKLRAALLGSYVERLRAQPIVKRVRGGQVGQETTWYGPYSRTRPAERLQPPGRAQVDDFLTEFDAGGRDGGTRIRAGVVANLAAADVARANSGDPDAAYHDCYYGDDCRIKPKKPEQTIEFDDDTMITTVTTKVTYEHPSVFELLPILFDAARPQNWHNGSNDFFTESAPGIWRNGRFDKSKKAQDEAIDRWYNDPHGAELLEKTRYNWSPQSTAENELVLTISGFEESATALRYCYHLHHCERFEVGPTAYRSIMQRDEGWLEIVADKEAKTVTIEAMKRVHYADADREAATFLNLASPALIATFMHALVIDNTQRVLNYAAGTSGSGAPAASRPRGPKTNNDS